ncbi:hypothetical protein GCM10027275_20020 [Rhabdobacter roseus]|uniref:Uncharacterized protein n=1 Tax=Rhabdobacter roseus TaxID=1655419 RepID=A0A840TRR7_9BACT|nr:hypothetical protein [Rhabdobacter roseus]MBB5283933.1 hypothetical protein [Rhabdobacter roseus]
MRMHYLCVIAWLWTSSWVQGQVVVRSSQDSTAPGYQEALSLYRKATAESQHLYNGSRYFFYDKRAKTHPFFETENWEEGTVHYDGLLHESIPMVYDILKDQVVIKHIRGYGNVQLNRDRVKYFRMLDHTFVWLQAEQNVGIRTGFHDLLYDGETKVWARRIKDRQERIDNMVVVVEFNAKNTYYLQQGGTFRVIHSKKAFLNLLADQKKPLKRYLRQQKINYRQDRENALVKMTAYYDQLVRP